MFVCSFVSFVRFVGVGRTVFMRQRNYKETLIKEGKILKAKDRNEGYIYTYISRAFISRTVFVLRVQGVLVDCSCVWPLLINVV